MELEVDVLRKMNFFFFLQKTIISFFLPKFKSLLTSHVANIREVILNGAGGPTDRQPEFLAVGKACKAIF